MNNGTVNGQNMNYHSYMTSIPQGLNWLMMPEFNRFRISQQLATLMWLWAQVGLDVCRLHDMTFAVAKDQRTRINQHQPH